MNSVWWAVNANLSPMPCLPSKLSIFPEVFAEYYGRLSWDCASALKVIFHESSEIQCLMEWISCPSMAFISCSHSPRHKLRFSTILPCETPNNSAGSSYFLIKCHSVFPKFAFVYPVYNCIGIFPHCLRYWSLSIVVPPYLRFCFTGFQLSPV